MDKLKDHEGIITAFAENAAGPGWVNRPIWVVIRDRNTGLIRVDCLQPEEHTSEMSTLFNVSQAVHLAMTVAVEKKLRNPNG